MKKIQTLLLVLPVIFFLSFATAKHLTSREKKIIKVPEPSDICFSKNGNTYIVSDNGYLYQTDGQGKIIRKSSFTGTDFEGVYADEQYVYIMDESARRVHKLDQQKLERVATYDLPYNGARNSGYESITFNEEKKVFVTVSEKNPVTIFEYDKDFRKLNEIPFHKARDISSATWHEGNIWLLSDEDMKVFKLDPNTYKVKDEFSISVINPEGIAFDPAGNLVICSDDRQMLYFFNKP
jgi:uncharacterized protein YjiK